MKLAGLKKWFHGSSAGQEIKAPGAHCEKNPVSAYLAGELLPPLRIRYDEVPIPESILNWMHACRLTSHRDMGAEYFQTLAAGADLASTETLQWAATSLYQDGQDDALSQLATHAQLWLGTHAQNQVIRHYSRFMGHMYPGLKHLQTITEEQARTESPAWMRDDWALFDMAKASCDEERVARLNDLLRSKGLTTLRLEAVGNSRQPALDRLIGSQRHMSVPSPIKGTAALVSIIVPVYNAHDTVETSIRSLLAQTWQQIEIIAVNDASTDESLQVLEHLARDDPRLKVLNANVNRGAYSARNLGLAHANGHYVTIADSDDWHHPQKIEMQVKCLMANSGLIASMSGGFRATDDLHPVARSRPYYKQANLSSLLFEREKVLATLGGWNSVRFGADTEFFNRMVMVFGQSAIHTIDLPLFIGRFRADSLTNDPLHGYVGHDLGARKEYVACYRHFQRHAQESMLRYPLQDEAELPFPVPNPAKASRDDAQPIKLVFAGDFQDPRQATWAIVQHQSARSNGQRPRLMHLPSFRPQLSDEVIGFLRDYLFKHAETLVTTGESLDSADIVTFAHIARLIEDRSISLHVEHERSVRDDASVKGRLAMPLNFIGNDEPFDLQVLYDLWTDLPDAFRLRGLDLRMKLANIHQSWLTGSGDAQEISDQDIATMAMQTHTTDSFTGFQECRKDDTQRAWAEALGLMGSFDPVSSANVHREALQQALREHRDYRLHALLVNLARNDDEWLTHMNAYMDAIGAPLLSLRNEPGHDRAMRIALGAAVNMPHENGPLVSIIMPCFNAQEHLRWAAGSILEQTWRNIELIAVDDCSTDGTPEILRELAASDPRVRLLRTPFNAGPYVAKNLGVEVARGRYITGHDADDWALPHRIQSQLMHQTALGQPVSVGHMIRFKTNGALSKIGLPSEFSPDGVLRKANISALFDADFMRARLGSWDNVRYGADSELLARAAVALGHKVVFANVLTMLCLDLDQSLTNHAASSIGNGDLSGNRLEYKIAWEAWHASLQRSETYLPVNQGRRFFQAPVAMQNTKK